MSNLLSSRITVDPEVLSRVVKDETLILNLKTELYLGLNESGTRMWQVLESSNTVQEAYDVLIGEYDVDPVELLRDLEEFIGSMVKEQLITLQAVA